MSTIRFRDCDVDIDGAKAHGRVAVDEHGRLSARLVVGRPETLVEPSIEDERHIMRSCLSDMLRRFGRISVGVGHHRDECQCWRCKERRGEEVYAPEFRARAADPTVCQHPDDDKAPVSGDGWLCGHCGDLVAPPPDNALLREQPAPADTGSRPVWELVIADVEQWEAPAPQLIQDMRDRDAQGRAKYGVPLTADNGRDHLLNAYQELLDGAVYLRATIENGNRSLVTIYRDTLRCAAGLRTVIELRSVNG